MTLQPSTPEWANDPDWGREFARQFPTVDAYLAHHQAAGHICCQCPQCDPPLPCCNSGHARAQHIAEQFDQLVRWVT